MGAPPARQSLTDQDGAIPIQPGARVLIAGEKATVRYVGPVEGQTGAWAGVEWDDAARGKHDGSAGGVAYFSVATPGAGSFVRLEKVHAGCSVEQALLARYAGSGGGGAPGGGGGGGGSDAAAAPQHAHHAQAYVLTSSQRKLFVQLVGEDAVAARQSRVDLLTSARLVGLGVSRVVRVFVGVLFGGGVVWCGAIAARRLSTYDEHAPHLAPPNSHSHTPPKQNQHRAPRSPRSRPRSPSST